MWNFPLLPESASEMSRADNWLMLFAVSVSVFFSALIAACITYFSIRYHHTVAADRSDPPDMNIPLEIAWSLIPFAIMLTLFVWGSRLYLRHYRPPADAVTIEVLGKQWMWKTEHPGGQREINALHLPLGKPIQLHMISQDVIHSFFVPAFRIKQDVLPGRYTSVWFTPTRIGVYHLFCAQYCGTLHSTMQGSVHVLSQADYERWLARAPRETTLSQEGARLFFRMGCAGCHGAENHRAPPLAGLFGSPVHLDDGRTVIADEAYIRESILFPGTKVVAGYKPIMPTFRGLINEEGLEEIVAYIKSQAGATVVPSIPGFEGEIRTREPAPLVDDNRHSGASRNPDDKWSPGPRLSPGRRE